MTRKNTCSAFESGVIKIQARRESQLTKSEKLAVKILKKKPVSEIAEEYNPSS